MPEFIDICEQAARAGAEQLLLWQGRIQAREKGPKDLVTEADLASQEVIAQIIGEHFPEHRFLGEEDEGALTASDWSGYLWVVDPLDGTANYVHGLPAFAVSIALAHDGQPIAGVVLDPLLDECFRAVRGGGATLNGQPIRASGCEQLSQSLLAASFSANVPRGSDEIARFVELLHVSQAVRRLGSAALNLAYVAAGRLDGYWASSVKPWDVAAGALLVTEAGGRITNLQGGEFELAKPQLASAATPALHEALIIALASATSV